MSSNKYLIEGNINFYSELMNDDESDDNTDNTNITHNNNDNNDNNTSSVNTNAHTIDRCLLTNEPLDETMVALPSCGHKFNYKPLYNEICQQKKVINSYETARLWENQIKCPYCRTICNFLLPPSSEYFGLPGVSLTKNVNTMAGTIRITCQHVKKKTVKNQTNVQCTTSKVYITKFGRYCSLHYNNLIKQNSKNQIESNKKDKNISTNKKDNIQIINELFSNETFNTKLTNNVNSEQIFTNNKNKQIDNHPKNKILLGKYLTINGYRSPHNIGDIRTAFDYFLKVDDIKLALNRYNKRAISHGYLKVTITHPKQKLLNIIIDYELYKVLELWEGMIISEYITKNMEKINSIPNDSAETIKNIINNKLSNIFVNTVDEMTTNDQSTIVSVNNENQSINNVNTSDNVDETSSSDDIDIIDTDDIELINYWIEMEKNNYK